MGGGTFGDELRTSGGVRQGGEQLAHGSPRGRVTVDRPGTRPRRARTTASAGLTMRTVSTVPIAGAGKRKRIRGGRGTSEWRRPSAAPPQRRTRTPSRTAGGPGCGRSCGRLPGPEPEADRDRGSGAGAVSGAQGRAAPPAAAARSGWRLGDFPLGRALEYQAGGWPIFRPDRDQLLILGQPVHRVQGKARFSGAEWTKRSVAKSRLPTTTSRPAGGPGGVPGGHQRRQQPAA